MAAHEQFSRRQFLSALVASGRAGGLTNASWSGTAGQVRRAREWVSGSQTLAPLTMHAGSVLFAGDRTLGKIHLASSRMVWKRDHQLADEPVYRPRAAGQRVLSGGQHELGAWDLGNGHQAWLRKARIQLGVPFVSPKVSFVGDGHELLAIDNSDGKVLWQFAGTLDTLSAYAPTVLGNTVYWGPGDGFLYAINASDGREKWRQDRSADWQYLRQMYVSNDVLVVGTYKELLCGVSTADGRVLWTFNAGNFINSHHVSGDAAYLWSPTGWVYAISILNGEVLWRHQTTNYGQSSANWGAMMAEIVVHQGLLYALDMNNVLHILDTSNGQEVKRLAFGQELRPVVLPGNGKWAVVANEAGRIQKYQW